MTLFSAREIVLYIEWHSGMGYLQNMDWKNGEKKPNFVDTSKCSNQGNKKVTQRKKQWPGCLVLYTQSILLLEDERSIVIKLDCYVQKNELLGITLNIFGGFKRSEISFWGAKRNEIWLWKTLSRSLSIMLINSKDKYLFFFSFFFSVRRQISANQGEMPYQKPTLAS